MVGVDARLAKAGTAPEPRRREPRIKGETPQKLNPLKQRLAAYAYRRMLGGGWVPVRAHTISARERLLGLDEAHCVLHGLAVCLLDPGITGVVLTSEFAGDADRLRAV